MYDEPSTDEITLYIDDNNNNHSFYQRNTLETNLLRFRLIYPLYKVVHKQIRLYIHQNDKKFDIAHKSCRKENIRVSQSPNRRYAHVLKVIFYLQYNINRLKDYVTHLPSTFIILFLKKLRRH
jgi:hypothetical protein